MKLTFKKNGKYTDAFVNGQFILSVKASEKAARKEADKWLVDYNKEFSENNVFI